MADINLLQGSEIYESEKKSNLRFFKWLGYGVLAASVLAYGALYLLNMKVKKDIAQASQDQQQIQSQIMQNPNYAGLLEAQNKLGDVKLLLDKHMVWEQVLPKFADATLKNATYTKFTADSTGGVQITGTVLNFQDLDKFMKGLKLPGFDYIKDVTLVNISIGSSTSNQNGINFTIKVTFNPNILKYATTQQQ